jgi:hypothetical protein
LETGGPLTKVFLEGVDSDTTDVDFAEMLVNRNTIKKRGNMSECCISHRTPIISASKDAARRKTPSVEKCSTDERANAEVGSICMQNLTHQKRLRVLCLFFVVVVVVVIVGFLPAGS